MGAGEKLLLPFEPEQIAVSGESMSCFACGRGHGRVLEFPQGNFHDAGEGTSPELCREPRQGLGLPPALSQPQQTGPLGSAL